ncbi:MAG: class I SAM-dependent methyltransferase [Bryobacteraceae bacterium]
MAITTKNRREQTSPAYPEPAGAGPRSAPKPPLSRLAEAAIAELGQRVIEVGCGAGHLTRRLLDREHVVALDPAREHVARVLGELGDRSNLDAFSMDIAGPRFRELSRFRPDSVLCLHSLERIADDHRALFNMLSVLRAGGRIVLLAHACPALFGPVDYALGHYRRYTADGLRVTAEAVGLRVVRLDYVNPAGMASWWWKAKVRKSATHATSGETTLDRWLHPVLQRLERWVKLPAGSTLFAVLERPAY